VLFAACTQSKPSVPTPTLVPLGGGNETLVAPSGNETPAAPDATLVVPPGGDQTTVPGGDQTPIAPVGGDQTPNAPEGQVTPIIGEPTLLPTPTTVGDTGQPSQPNQPAGQPTASTGASGTCSNPYTVQPGDWFYAIARKCGVSPQALLAANPGMNPNVLRPGQTLNMPAGSGGGAPPPPPSSGGATPPPSTGGGSGSCSNPYTVQRGDTLYSIAQRCGTTAAALHAANNIPAPEYIFPGQQLRIP